jgi:hypothetical protein
LRLLPLAVVAIAVATPILASKLSAMNITRNGVVVRNFPHRTRQIPLSEIDRFDHIASAGAWAQVRGRRCGACRRISY